MALSAGRDFARRLELSDFRFRAVGAVTGHTGDVPLIVDASGPQRMRATVVAGGADRAGLPRWHRGKSHNQRGIAASLDMRLPRSMAALAGAAGRRRRSRMLGLAVQAGLDLPVLIFVTREADLIA